MPSEARVPIAGPCADSTRACTHIGRLEEGGSEVTGEDIGASSDVVEARIHSPPRFDHFMDLPVELREFIWEIVMRDNTHMVSSWIEKCAEYVLRPNEFIHEHLMVPDLYNAECTRIVPRMCRVSNITRYETVGVYLRNYVVIIASIKHNQHFESFLQTVRKGYEAIRSIHFTHFAFFPTGYPQNVDLELAVRCTALHTIKLTFDVWKLEDWRSVGDNGGLTFSPRRVDEMWTHYKFDRLLDCHNLRNLRIEIKGDLNGNVLVASKSLGARIVAEFSARHQRDLQLTYSYVEWYNRWW